MTKIAQICTYFIQTFWGLCLLASAEGTGRRWWNRSSGQNSKIMNY